MNYSFLNFRDKKNERILEKHVKKLIKIFPHWVNEVSIVETQSDENGFIASVCLRPEYRRFTLLVYPEFYTLPENDQRYSLIHEIAHSINGQYANWVMTSLIEWLKDRHPDAYEIFSNEHINKFESVTEELTAIFEGFYD